MQLIIVYIILAIAVLCSGYAITRYLRRKNTDSCSECESCDLCDLKNSCNKKA
jgi:hypothetical protein